MQKWTLLLYRAWRLTTHYISYRQNLDHNRLIFLELLLTNFGRYFFSWLDNDNNVHDLIRPVLKGRNRCVHQDSNQQYILQMFTLNDNIKLELKYKRVVCACGDRLESSRSLSCRSDTCVALQIFWLFVFDWNLRSNHYAVATPSSLDDNRNIYT